MQARKSRLCQVTWSYKEETILFALSLLASVTGFGVKTQKRSCISCLYRFPSIFMPLSNWCKVMKTMFFRLGWLLTVWSEPGWLHLTLSKRDASPPNTVSHHTVMHIITLKYLFVSTSPLAGSRKKLSECKAQTALVSLCTFHTQHSVWQRVGVQKYL